ncbi:MAG: prolyl oligopeptidase family serine peptidase [Bacteroidia bacterium]|nr:prolyl oligopeptidase family serine peptidase [Bacteroidia bacterium]
MKRTLLIVAILFFTSLTSVLADNIVEYQKVKRMTFADLKKEWADKHAPEILVPIHNEVDIYDITYTTKWHDGSEIKATGLYMVPVNVNKAMPQVLYHHGTSVRKERSGMFFNGEEMLCYFFAADGYCVIMPDYIGLGKGEKRHLYQHADSEGQAAIDLMRAVNSLNEKININSNGQIFITGYSQGGHAAMATHKKLQDEYKGIYKVTASSPMSGAYDMTGAQSETMFKPYTQPHYLPYLYESYQEAYHVYDGDFYEAYRPEYREMLRRLYSGKYQHFQINDSLPKVPKNIFSDSMINQFLTNPSFPFKKRLEENNLYNWKPEAPVQLCYCKSDEEVNYKNSIVTYNKMKELGAKKVRKLNVSNKFSHGNCAGMATIHTKMYFDSFRKGSKNGTRGPLFKRFILRIGKWITPEHSLKSKMKRLEEKTF